MEPDRESERQVSPPVCCSDTTAIARHFDLNVEALESKGQAERMSPISQALLDQLIAVGPTGKTVLELGSGRAGLLIHLVQAGARKATGVDVSATSIDFARRRFVRAGLAERAEFVLGNGAVQELRPHDWVILDRAICCYPDLDEMLSNSIAAARELYAYTVPESRGARGAIARVGWALENRLIDPLRRASCPGYVHDLERIDQSLTRAGFTEAAHDHRNVWHMAVWRRPGTERA